MFHIAYNKQTKFILYSRYDENTAGQQTTLQNYLEDFCSANNLEANNYTAVELPFNPKAIFVIGRDKFDESDNTIYADPDWVEPPVTPIPTPTE